MLNNIRPDLSNARLLQARECLESAEREFAANAKTFLTAVEGYINT
jgi:hypothetical protein